MKQLILLTPLLLALAPMRPATAGGVESATSLLSIEKETRSVTLDITGMT